MRPTRITAPNYNPYDELAQLADPEPDSTDPSGRIRDNPSVLVGLSDDEQDDRGPLPDRSRRRKRGSLPGAMKLAARAVVCATLLAAGDRLAMLYAEEKAEDEIQQSLGLAARPDVEIAGFPFVGQVLEQRIDQVDVTLPDVAADKVSLASVHATARDVRVVGDLPTAIQGIAVDRIDGNVLLAFDDLNRELGASRITLTSSGPDGIHIAGSLPVADRTLRLRAEARVTRNGERAVSTTVAGMRLEIPGLFTYRPGKDPGQSGLHLHPQAAARISHEVAQAKALLSIPAIVQRLGIPESRIHQAIDNEKELSQLTGSPHFIEQLTKVNLVDLVVDHPWLLEKVGVSPHLVTALLNLRPPELSDRLSLSFELPKSSSGDIRLRDIVVEREGIRVNLTGSGLTFGTPAPERTSP